MSDVHYLSNKINKAWNDFTAKVKTMGSGCSARPTMASEIFLYKDGAPIEVTVKPICFRLKDRPQSQTPNLYVVVDGLIFFKIDEDKSIRAVESQTRVGYFLHRDGKLVHVFGVHHDFDNTHVAHPVFHSQIAPMMDLGENVKQQWKMTFDEEINQVQNDLPNIRIPSAQMDAFSVFLQLCSDHLIYSKSGKPQISAYQQAIALCGFFEGAYTEVPRLQSAIARRCLRPNHWYDGAILPAAKTRGQAAA